MAGDLELRESRPDDVAAISALYPAAFPEEDLLPLVRELLGAGPSVLSLAGLIGGVLAGHAFFTHCGIRGGSRRTALLGPLAVAPAWQGQGIGTALVRAGLGRLASAGIARVFVLGDPAFYGRIGFAPDEGVAPPYPLPEEWRDGWQSLGLSGKDQPLNGVLSVPGPWRNPALWAP